MSTKLTKRDMFEAIVGVLESVEGTEDLVEFVGKQIDMLDKRAETPRKPSATQVANEALKVEIAEVLEAGPLTATEVAKSLESEPSVQKVSQLLRQMIESGIVSKTPAKGKEKALFSLSE